LAELTTRSERVRARIAHARGELAALEKVLAERHELQLVVARVEEFAQRLRKGLSSLSWGSGARWFGRSLPASRSPMTT
jgi:hypothetical protein